jgi:hypothetical protein
VEVEGLEITHLTALKERVYRQMEAALLRHGAPWVGAGAKD